MPEERIQISNQMILASAGSGKTYRLTDRFISLMALGEAPEAMIALTFTRKAAGEFFDEILKKLAGAATDEGVAARIKAANGLPDFDSRQARKLLRRMVSRTHALSLGTLDSFFVSIVQAFPFELGMSGGFEILDDYALMLARQEVWARVFQDVGANEKARRSFLDAFKRSTFGKEERRLGENLDEFLKWGHRLIVKAPDRHYWGNADLIWPGGVPYVTTAKEAKATGQRLLGMLEARAGGEHAVPPKSLEKWADFVEAVASLQPGDKLGKEFDTLQKNMGEVWDRVEDGHADFNVERKRVYLGPDECGALTDLVSYMDWCDLASNAESAVGIWEILNRYEEVYHQLVRRTGRLTFEDVQWMLSGKLARAHENVAEAHLEERWQSVEYRLDGQYRHWLLDEFQDTSFGQWEVIENLIDEVVQDTSGERSLFYVGDVKQAIYGWRGGDSRLFWEIFGRYNQGSEDRIQEHPMHQSWRSGPVIIQTLNAIFGNRDALAANFPAAMERWEKEWQPHDWAKDTEGCVTYLQAAGKEAEARYEVALGLLKKLRPGERRLKCAVLVRENQTARQLVEYVRARSEIPIKADTELEMGRENPLTSALYSLLKWLAHPGDRFAWEHVLMTPFAEMVRDGERGPNWFRAQTAREIHDHGFEAVIQGWLSYLEENWPGELDAFATRRAGQFRAAARRFDSEGDRSIDRFLAYLDHYTDTDPTAKGVVEVMTIHKAKGLGFDAVILCDIDKDRPEKGTGGELVSAENERREIQWVTRLPRKAAARRDPVMAAFLDQRAAEREFESLCNFYVAMTRAKQGCYVVFPVAGRSGYPPAYELLGSVIGEDLRELPFDSEVGASVLFTTGNEEWYLEKSEPVSEEEESSEAEPDAEELKERLRPKPPRAPRRSPSGEADAVVEGANVFAAARVDAATYGTAVHALFEGILWLGENGLQETRRTLEEIGRGYPEQAEAAFDEVMGCLEEPGLRQLFTPSHFGEGILEVWREKNFELLLDGSWMTGTIDRAVIRRDLSGMADRAWILDFKTNRVETEEEIASAMEHYQPQLNLYRRALGALLGLEEKNISCHLLFSRPREAREVSRD